MNLHEIFTITLLSIACYLAVLIVLAMIVLPLIAYATAGFESAQDVFKLLLTPSRVMGVVWGVLVFILAMMGDV